MRRILPGELLYYRNILKQQGLLQQHMPSQNIVCTVTYDILIPENMLCGSPFYHCLIIIFYIKLIIFSISAPKAAPSAIASTFASGYRLQIFSVFESKFLLYYMEEKGFPLLWQLHNNYLYLEQLRQTHL